MTKTTESVSFLFSPPMQACYSLSSAPTTNVQHIQQVYLTKNQDIKQIFLKLIYITFNNFLTHLANY